MSNLPKDLKYNKEHEWVKIDGAVATVGITDYAQDHLGDVVYIELPKAGAELTQMQEFGVVESVKSVSSLYCPVAGRVLEINPILNDSPALVNESPYDKAWMIKVEMSNPGEADALLSADEYAKLL